jgi:D-aminoacyl-tRNA deacylase
MQKLFPLPNNTQLKEKREQMILIAASQLDIASLNIKQQILNHYPFSETNQSFQQNPTYKAEINNQKITLITLNQESVTAQNLPQAFPEAQLIVFISRHSSQSGKPTLTVHTPGNFADAELGGLPKTVSTCPAVAMKDALKALATQKEQLSLNYEVSYEVTHHGPSLNAPAMFVELGSSEPQWRDTLAAEAVAHAAMSAIQTFNPKPTESAVIGIGGTHYNQKFTRLALEGEAVFGHMIPKYAVANINADMLSQCIERTLEKVSHALLDWKGIKSEDKTGLTSALEKTGLKYMKI